MKDISPFIDDGFRKDVDVLQRFGDAFYQNSSIGKTQLYLASKLRWDSFLKYIDWMKKNEHIESGNEQGSETFRLTAQGREMFHRLERFLEAMKAHKSLAAFLILDAVVFATWITHMF